MSIQHDLLKGGLIVSCQALEDEPLHSAFIMGRMAEQRKKAEHVESEPILWKILRKYVRMCHFQLLEL